VKRLRFIAEIMEITEGKEKEDLFQTSSAKKYFFGSLLHKRRKLNC
jgi:hypothetical protein